MLFPAKLELLKTRSFRFWFSVIALYARISKMFCFFLLLLVLFLNNPVFAQSEELAVQSQDRVYLIHVEGPIDNGLAHYIDRSIQAAESNNASAILLVVDTFGGLVDAADQIRQSILDTPIRTVAFIDKNAASAGALISLACDEIYMASGSSIGAATVVEGTGGEKASEKMQSYMRGLMRATAEANGRDPRIAEAMVDESIAIEGIIEEGKLLTLSDQEALRFGISDSTFLNTNELFTALEWEEFMIVDNMETWQESFLRFLANPVVSGILMLMMMSGLYFEFQTPGFGFGGAAAMVGAALFFAPLYIMGLAESWEIILFVAGILLLLAEVFIIPGFGVAGIAGAGLILFSLGASLIGNTGLQFPDTQEISQAIWVLVGSLSGGIFLLITLGRYIPKNSRLNFLVLKDTLAFRNEAMEEGEPLSVWNGKTGVALTPLRPSGIVKIDERRVDVTTEGDFIESGEPVKVVQVKGSQVIVASDSKK